MTEEARRQQGDLAAVGREQGHPAAEIPWRRLDPRMLVVTPATGIVRLLPAFAVLILTGRSDDLSRVWWSLGAAAVIVAFGALRWRFTRYRITPDRVELHSGWLNRQRRSVPRDRIRTVDLTSKPAHRVFRLTVVKIGAATGPGRDEGLSLDAVSKAEAARLRVELLSGARGANIGSARPAPTPSAEAEAPRETVLARLDWGWIRFAPLTFSSLAGVGVVIATLFNLLREIGIDPADAGRTAVDDLARVGLTAALAVLVLALLVLAVVGALVLFAERWFGYVLTREPDRSLRVRRGLLTRRSLSVAEQRLRGVEMVEPVLLRAGRGAQTRALAAGLAKDTQGGVLQPPVPRAEAHRVAALVTGAPPEETTQAPLRVHPVAARRRRLIRALVPTALLVVLAFLVEPHVAGPVSLALLPVMALVGLDRGRVLGHTVTGGYLVTREGSIVRRTVAVQRGGVIGWRVRQSVFQRRAGVATVEAVTAAGSGGYRVLDMAASDVAPLLATTTITLLQS